MYDADTAGGRVPLFAAALQAGQGPVAAVLLHLPERPWLLHSHAFLCTWTNHHHGTTLWVSKRVTGQQAQIGNAASLPLGSRSALSQAICCLLLDLPQGLRLTGSSTGSMLTCLHDHTIQSYHAAATQLISGHTHLLGAARTVGGAAAAHQGSLGTRAGRDLVIEAAQVLCGAVLHAKGHVL